MKSDSDDEGSCKTSSKSSSPWLSKQNALKIGASATGNRYEFYCKCTVSIVYFYGHFSRSHQANSYHTTYSKAATPHSSLPRPRQHFSPTPPTSARQSISSSPSSSSSTSQISQSKPKEIDRELIQNIATLQSLFPVEQKSHLVAMLARCDNNVDRAIDRLMDSGREEGN